MTADQFNAALIAAGFPTEIRNGVMSLGQTELAAVIGVDGRTVRRWASGEAEVPTAVAMLLNLMLKTKTPPEKLKS